MQSKIYLCVLLAICTVVNCKKQVVFCGDKDDDREIQLERNDEIVSCRTLADFGQWSDCQKYELAADYCPCSCEAFADNKQPTHDKSGGGNKGGGKKSSGGSGCFSGDSLVTLRNGEHRTLEELVTSENKFPEVLTTDTDGQTTYSPIVFWGHALPDHEMEFLKISTQNGSQLILTPKHLIPIFENDITTANADGLASVFAEKASVGQFLLRKSENSPDFELDKIVAIERLMRRGIYLPVTRTGTIVVNDILASCYSEVEDHYSAHLVFGLLTKLYDWLPESVLSLFGVYGARNSEPGILGLTESIQSVELPTVIELVRVIQKIYY